MAVTITKQPQDVAVALNADFTMSVEATGSGELTYQWYYKSASSTSWKESAQTAATFSLPLTSVRVDMSWRCVVTDSDGSVTSGEAKVMVAVTTAITKQPCNLWAEVGTVFSLSVEAVGNDLEYQWYVKCVSDDQWWKYCTSATTPSTKMASEYDAATFYCVVTGLTGEAVTSDTVTAHMLASSKAAYSVKLEFGSVSNGKFTASKAFGPDVVKSVSVSRTIGDDGRPAPGIAEAAQCDVSMLSSSVINYMSASRWVRASVGVLDPDTATYSWTKLGVFKPDRSTVKDDQLFTTFTAYDCLYWLTGDMSIGAGVEVDGTTELALSDMWDELSTKMLSLGVVVNVPSWVPNMSYGYLAFRPKGTVREVLADVLLLSGLCATTDGDGAVVTVPNGDDGVFIERGQYGAGSLDASGDMWRSTMLGVVADVSCTVNATDNDDGGSVSAEIDVAKLSWHSPSTTNAGGYLVTPDFSTLFYDGIPVKKATLESVSLEDLVDADITTLSGVIGDHFATCYKTGTGIQYDGLSVDVNGLADVTVGDAVLVERAVYSGVYRPICTSVEVSYDGGVKTTIGAESASYENDTYEVASDYSVTRNESVPVTTSTLATGLSTLSSDYSGLSSTVSSLPTFRFDSSNKTLYITMPS